MLNETPPDSEEFLKEAEDIFKRPTIDSPQKEVNKDLLKVEREKSNSPKVIKSSKNHLKVSPSLLKNSPKAKKERKDKAKKKEKKNFFNMIDNNENSENIDSSNFAHLDPKYENEKKE